jgi:hypothetical protein
VTHYCPYPNIHLGDLAKARQEIERSPEEFSTMMLGQVLVREGKAEEALPKLKVIPGGRIVNSSAIAGPSHPLWSVRRQRNNQKPISALSRSRTLGISEQPCRRLQERGIAAVRLLQAAWSQTPNDQQVVGWER